MDIQLLLTFKTVIEAGSATRAAERLHCVQSNVTARIKLLEDLFGVPVFDRQGKRLVLNSAGRTLLPYAEKILRLWAESKSAVAGTMALRPQFFLGSMESASAARLPGALAALHHLHPDTDVLLHTGPSSALVKKLIDGQLDAVLMAADTMRPEFEYTPVLEETLVAVTDRLCCSLTREILQQKALITFHHGCPYRAAAESWYAKESLSPRKVISMGTYGAILGCAAAGMGVAFLPEALVASNVKRREITAHPLPRLGPITTFLVVRDAESNSLISTDLVRILHSSVLTNSSHRSLCMI